MTEYSNKIEMKVKNIEVSRKECLQMENKFARLVSSSETREIVKVTERQEVISFAGGLPVSELFPVEALKVGIILY